MDRNRIDELSNGRTEDVNNKWFVGEEIGVYYDWVYDGIWKTEEAEEAAKYGRKPGQIKVKDLNNDDTIDANDDKKIALVYKFTSIPSTRLPLAWQTPWSVITLTIAISLFSVLNLPFSLVNFTITLSPCFSALKVCWL